MSPGVRRITARAAEDILARYGFEMVSQKGSHRKWRNNNRRLQIIVPSHKGRELPIGTLRNIMVHAEIPESEWHSA